MNELYQGFEKVPFIFMSTYYAPHTFVWLFKKNLLILTMMPGHSFWYPPFWR